VSIKLDNKELVRQTVMSIVVSHDSPLVVPGPPGQLFVRDSNASRHLLIFN
jgi:hypothetical protein